MRLALPMTSRMRFARSTALLLAVAAFSWLATARAEDMGSEAVPNSTPPVAERPPERLPTAPRAPDVFAVRRLALEAHLGFATPVGELGLVTEYSVHPVLGLGAGVGIGWAPGNDNALRGALLARLRPLRGRNNALVLGAAYSFGGFHRYELRIGDLEPPPVADRADWAHWAQFDVGWERRADKGFLIRLSMGGAILLNPADLVCAPADAARCQPTTSQSLFTFDLTLGYAGPV